MMIYNKSVQHTAHGLQGPPEMSKMIDLCLSGVLFFKL